MNLNIEIEACIEHPSSGPAAQAAGATRIELNCALQLDGLTPTLAACRWLKSKCGLPIIAMLRPRNAFYLDDTDQQLAVEDGQALLEAGVAGLAYGALDHCGELNLKYIQQIVELCGERSLVCHRAFDRVVDQRRGLEQLIDCGVRRVLTSGGAATALEGRTRLRELLEWARGRIEILPAGGICATNARQLINATGCTQLHGTFRQDPTEIVAVCQNLNDTSR